MTPTSGVDLVVPSGTTLAGHKRSRPDSCSRLCHPKRARRASDTPEAEAAARSAYRILCVRLGARV